MLVIQTLVDVDRGKPQEIAYVLTCRKAGLHEAFLGPLGGAQALDFGKIEQAALGSCLLSPSLVPWSYYPGMVSRQMRDMVLTRGGDSCQEFCC